MAGDPLTQAEVQALLSDEQKAACDAMTRPHYAGLKEGEVLYGWGEPRGSFTDYRGQFSAPNAQMLPASAGFDRRVLQQFFNDKAEIEAEQRRMQRLAILDDFMREKARQADTEAEQRMRDDDDAFARAFEATRHLPSPHDPSRQATIDRAHNEWIETGASSRMRFDSYLDLYDRAIRLALVAEERASQPPSQPASRDISPEGVQRDVESVIDHLLNERTTAKQRRGLDSAIDQANRVKSGSNEAIGRAISGRPPSTPGVVSVPWGFR